MSPKRKLPADEQLPDSSTPHTKKTKTRPQVSTRTATARRILIANSTSDSPSKEARSTLVPTIPRRNAILGQRDDSLLRLPCTNTKTGRDQEQHFQKRNASEIDWHDRRHIDDINNWSNQIYTRAGLLVKEVDAWLPDEEAWIELYIHLSIAETRRRGIRQARTKEVWEAFLAFFQDRELVDRDGEAVDRKPRTCSAFSAKFRRFEQLAERLRQCMRGKSGDVFRPGITEARLNKFKAMKAEMAAKGLRKESAYAGEHFSDWLDFFSQLPTETDVDGTETDGREEEQDDLAVNEDIGAAATLISMASQPKSMHTPAKARIKRETNDQGVDPAVRSSPTSPYITHATPARATQDSEVDDTPDFSRSSPLPASSIGPHTPQSSPTASPTKDKSSDRTTHDNSHVDVVYPDSH